MEEVTNATTVVESTLSNTTTPIDETQDSPAATWRWITAGAAGGLCLLVAVLLLIIIISVVVTKKRRKKNYSVSGQAAAVNKRKKSNAENTTSQMRTLKYHRGNSTTTERSTSVNSRSNMHVTVGRTESGQHKHMQVVNKGYLLASNGPHQNDRVATAQRRPVKPRVPLSQSKPREEEGEDYDSDYSEVAIMTEVANMTKVHVRENEGSLGMSIHQNVAYELDEDDIATVNSVRQAAAVFGSPIKTGGGAPPPQVKKKPPETKVKPKRTMSSSQISNLEASIAQDAPKINRPLCIEESTADSIYDMVRGEYGGELETTLDHDHDIPPQRQQSNEQPQYSNTCCSVQGSMQEQSGGYYNHRDIELMKHAEVHYGNLKEDSEPDYENIKKESNTGEVFYGNLNQKKVAEESDYYNRREMMISNNS